MADKIKIVQRDTRPQIRVALTYENSDPNATPVPVDITGCTPRLFFRRIGETVLLDTLVGVVLDGPAGLAAYEWNPASLDVDITLGDEFEGQIEVTFADGGRQTVYDLVKFKMRAEFA